MTEGFVFWGGYSGNNLGDEAILWAMSRLIRKLRPEAKQYVLIPDGVPAHVKAQYDAWQIEVVSGPMPGSLNVLRHARLIVGGGQMVDDTTLAWPVGWSSVFLGINSLSRQKPLVLCVGAEPLKHPLTRFLVRSMYGKAMACTCRDEESAAVLRDAGVSPAKVWITRDVVFSLDRRILPQYQPETGRCRVALVIAYDPNRVTDAADRYSGLIDSLLKQGIEVQVIAHDLRADYDIRARDGILEMYRGNPGVLSSDARSVDDVLQLYSRSDAVISGRMHPLILASLAGTLPIALGGKAKVRSLMRLSGIPELTASVTEEQSRQVRSLLQDRATILPGIAAAVDQFRVTVEDVTRRALSL